MVFGMKKRKIEEEARKTAEIYFFEDYVEESPERGSPMKFGIEFVFQGEVLRRYEFRKENLNEDSGNVDQYAREIRAEMERRGIEKYKINMDKRATKGRYLHSSMSEAYRLQGYLEDSLKGL